MMDLKSVGMTWHPQYMESHKIPWFQTTNMFHMESLFLPWFKDSLVNLVNQPNNGRYSKPPDVQRRKGLHSPWNPTKFEWQFQQSSTMKIGWRPFFFVGHEWPRFTAGLCQWGRFQSPKSANIASCSTFLSVPLCFSHAAIHRYIHIFIKCWTRIMAISWESLNPATNVDSAIIHWNPYARWQ